MAVDHGAVCLLDHSGLWERYEILGGVYVAMRFFGRLAFPLFSFLLVQGFLYTKNWRRYLFRVAVLAAVSEIPFDLVMSGQVFHPGTQSSLVLFVIALLCMKAMENRGIAENGVIALAGCAAAYALRADYGAQGMLFILTLYWFRGNPSMRMLAGCAALAAVYFDFFAAAACYSFFFINRYTGERGRNLGYLPYFFYPAHLILLYIAGVWIHGIYF